MIYCLIDLHFKIKFLVAFISFLINMLLLTKILEGTDSRGLE